MLTVGATKRAKFGHLLRLEHLNIEGIGWRYSDIQKKLMNERTEKRHFSRIHLVFFAGDSHVLAMLCMSRKAESSDSARADGGCLDCFPSTSADCCMPQVSARYALRTFSEVKVEEFLWTLPKLGSGIRLINPFQ